jgi:delta1-piperideine-2-carboxylate reductase
MDDQVALSLDDLRALIRRALSRGGMHEPSLSPVTETMLACERDGVRSHGLLRLPGFIHSMQVGWADGAAQPRVIDSSAGMCLVDACNGFAQAALALVRERLMDMARATGVAVLLTRDCHHFAALWPDIEPFAENGFVALTCVNSRKRMAVWGGAKPITGTSALAFASPRGGQPPLIWDQSSSIMSQGEMLLAIKEGRSVPPGIGIDAEGGPTTSPSAILDGGALLPFGGHKGSAIAVMVELLAAGLTGSPFGFEDRSPGGPTTSKGGQFVLVLDPRRGNPQFDDRANDLMAAVVQAGAGRLPGDRRYQRRLASIRDGVRLTRSELESLRKLAAAD